ncbi:MAG: DinB family protein [Gemmatimonadaceae bacterium]
MPAEIPILIRLYNHMAWADDRALTSLREMTVPPSQAVDLFAHILGAEHEWLCRIEARRSSHTIWPKLSLAKCATLARENHAAFKTLAENANGEAGQRMVTYRNSSGAEHTTSLEDILLHVAQHGMYHRGQIALLVRANGGTAIPTDYIVHTRL